MIERQVSFAGGELSPTLWGRTDLSVYPIGGRTLLNFFVSPHGVAMNRPGTKHVDIDNNFAQGVRSTCRVVPYVFSPTSAWVLLFSDFRIAIYKQDATGKGGFSLEQIINAPFPSSSLSTLRFAQVGYVMTIASPLLGTPFELRRLSAGNWTIASVSFDVPTYTSVLSVGDGLSTTPVPILRQNHDFGGDSSHPPREWQWQVTQIVRRVDGTLYETMPYTLQYYLSAGAIQQSTGVYSSIPSFVPVYPDWNQAVDVGQNATPASIGTVGDTVIAHRIYRGRDGTYGFVGETKKQIFYDEGAVPDFANPPPQGYNPFKVYSGSTLLRTENPSCVTFFESRRMFGGTAERPNFAWGSSVNSYSNFDEIIPADDSDALSFGLASLRNENIRAMIPRDKLIVLTSAAEWVVAGAGQEELVTPNSISAHLLSEHGCSDKVAPVAASEAIFFLQAKGVVPRAMSLDQNGYRAADISLMSRHLFDGYTVLDWAWAEDPFKILWVVRSDGALLSLTYIPEQQMLAWARHTITGGLVESVATVPYGSEDVVVMMVNRSGVRSLEVFASRLITDIRKSVFLDQAGTYDGTNTDATNAATVTDFYSNGGAVGLNVRIVFATPGNPAKPVTGNVIRFDDPAGGESVHLLLGTEAPAGTFDAQVLNVTVPTGILGVLTTGWYLCTTTLTGLGHMEGLTVTALADGNVIENLVVAGGAVDLGAGNYTAIAAAGRGYVSDFESLDAINEKARTKIVKRVLLELEYTRGGYVGASLDGPLEEVKTRQVSDSYGVLPGKRELVRNYIQDKWALDGVATGRVAFRQTAPLPAAILGISRDIEYGG